MKLILSQVGLATSKNEILARGLYMLKRWNKFMLNLLHE